jgi:hypothetical protein
VQIPDTTSPAHASITGDAQAREAQSCLATAISPPRIAWPRERLNRMARDLPESVAAQAALADVIAELTRLEPRFLGLIFEDRDIREAYDAAVAERPATPTARPV